MSCATAAITLVDVGMDADIGAAGQRGAGQTAAAVGRFRPAVALGFAVGFAVIAVHSVPGPGTHGTSLLVSLAMVGMAAGLLATVFTIDRPDAAHFDAIAVLAGGSMALLWLQPLGNAGLTGIAAAIVFMAARLRQRPWLMAIVAGTVFALLVAETSRQRTLSASVALCFPVVAICVLTTLVQRLRDAKEQAESLLAQVEANRHAQAEAAALAERQHLAREMHDVLAHSLSGLMLHLEGARMLAGSSPTDPRLPLAVDRAHELAKEGLTEARHAIGMLRDEQLPGPEALNTLTGQFTRHSGIPCSFAASGTPLVIRPDARLAVYRVTQEALTNVVKHAHADRVEVRLIYAADHAGLTIEDFGPGRGSDGSFDDGFNDGQGDESSSSSSGGYGLTGMRERAELLGGSLDAGRTSTGFRVCLRVPA